MLYISGGRSEGALIAKGDPFPIWIFLLLAASGFWKDPVKLSPRSRGAWPMAPANTGYCRLKPATKAGFSR
jgi:hypothetical protein